MPSEQFFYNLKKNCGPIMLLRCRRPSVDRMISVW